MALVSPSDPSVVNFVDCMNSLREVILKRWHILTALFLILVFAFSTQVARPQDNPRSDRVNPQAEFEEAFIKDGTGWHGDPLGK